MFKHLFTLSSHAYLNTSHLPYFYVDEIAVGAIYAGDTGRTECVFSERMNDLLKNVKTIFSHMLLGWYIAVIQVQGVAG